MLTFTLPFQLSPDGQTIVSHSLQEIVPILGKDNDHDLAFPLIRCFPALSVAFRPHRARYEMPRHGSRSQRPLKGNRRWLC